MPGAGIQQIEVIGTRKLPGPEACKGEEGLGKLGPIPSKEGWRLSRNKGETRQKRECAQSQWPQPSWGPLHGHLKTEGTTTSPHQGCSQACPAPRAHTAAQGPLSRSPCIQGPQEWSQHLPFPLVALGHLSNHRSQLGSRFFKPATLPTTLPPYWGSILCSVKLAPLCLTVSLWTPGGGSLSCQLLSPERGPPPQGISPSPPRHLNEVLLPAFLGGCWGTPGSPLPRPLSLIPA